MATRTCRECTTAFAVGLPACPQCQSEDHEETGMPKITVHAGPSNADEPVEEVTQEWDGTPSSPSTDEPQKNSEESETLPLKPAPTTEPLSSKTTEGSSSAPSKSTSSGRKTAK